MSPKKSTPKKSGEGRSAARKTATSKVTTSNTAQPRAGAAKKATTVKPDQMDEELLEFIQAIDDYKRNEGRPFPTWSEILDIVKELGYERSA